MSLNRRLFLRCLAPLLLCCASAVHADDAVREGQDGMMGRAQDVLERTRNGFESLMDRGMSFLGVKYRFGGTGPETGGFDCSGLVRRVFSDALSLGLPRTAAEMARLGEKIGKAELKPGDLVFFNTRKKVYSHVGIYVGDGKFLHAPSKKGVVRVESMDSSYWQKRFNGARRVLPEDAAQSELTPVSLPAP